MIQMVEYFNEHWYKVTVPKTIDAAKPDELEDIYIPSVTTKLGIISKPFLAKWRGDVGNREADMRLFESSERGVRIHNAWYTLTTQGAVVYNPINRPNYSNEELDKISLEYAGNIAVIKYQDEMLDVWKLQRWMQIVNPKVLYSEVIVYSLKNKDAGTADNIFKIEEGEYAINGSKPLYLPKGNYVVDLKTGNQVDDNAFLQTAPYAKCAEEMNLVEKINGTLIIHTGSKTKKGIEGLSTLYRNEEEMEQDYKGYRLASGLWEHQNQDASPKVFEFPALLTLKGESNGS